MDMVSFPFRQRYCPRRKIEEPPVPDVAVAVHGRSAAGGAVYAFKGSYHTGTYNTKKCREVSPCHRTFPGRDLKRGIGRKGRFL